MRSIGALGPAVVVAAMAAVVMPSPVAATLVSDYTEAGSESVASGVTHGWGTSQTDAATQNILVLRVAQGAPDVRFEVGLPFGRVDGRRRTSRQAVDYSTNGHRVVAAVNGDFWQTSRLGVVAPAGLSVRNGELVSGGVNDRGAFGMRADGSRLIGTPHLRTTLSLPGGVTIDADAINKIRDDNSLVVYTPRFAARTGTDATGVEVRLTGGSLPLMVSGTFTATVAEIRSGAGDTPIGATELVLSATGAAADALAALHPTDRVTLTTTIDPDWRDVQTVVGGMLLMTAGETVELTDEKFTLANPRTAVGLTADGSAVIATVDGRSDNSGGMALDDLADVLRSMGVVDALNLDGGGSTVMVVDPAGDAPLAVANNPSGPYERGVNTTLQIASTAIEALGASAPRASIVAGTAAGKTEAAVKVAWTTTGHVARIKLEVKHNDGPWQDVAVATTTATSATQAFRFGDRYRFRVRVADGRGNVTGWANSPTYVLASYNESDPRVYRAGAWTVKFRKSAIDTHIARSGLDASDHTMSMPFTGVQIAVVAQKSANAGTATCSLDGQARNVNLHSSTRVPRFVAAVLAPAASSGGLTPVSTKIDITHVGDASGRYVEIDAFLVLGQS